MLTRGRLTGRIFHGGEGKLMWYQPVGSKAVSCSSCADAIIDFFAVYIAALTQQYFSVGRTTPRNCPLPSEDLGLHLTHGSFGPPESPTQTASRSVYFLQDSRTRPADRQDRETRQTCRHADTQTPFCSFLEPWTLWKSGRRGCVD